MQAPERPTAHTPAFAFVRLAVMVSLRPLSAEPSTTALLEPFLALAVNWSMDRPDVSLDEIRADPALYHYVRDWGQDGDLAIAAYGDDDLLVGAAWLRTFSSAPGFGWVAHDIPELSIAVDPQHQGQGIGTAALNALLQLARFSGVGSVSLAVEEGNGAAHLYTAQGFSTVGLNGNSLVMLRDLR